MFRHWPGSGFANLDRYLHCFLCSDGHVQLEYEAWYTARDDLAELYGRKEEVVQVKEGWSRVIVYYVE
jgi:hypothetical protein